MKRLVLGLLFSSSLIGGIEYPEIVSNYLFSIEFPEQEQHDRVERALFYLEGMDKEDLCMVMGYLYVLLQKTDAENDGGCDCCTDIDELIEEEFGDCIVENCC